MGCPLGLERISMAKANEPRNWSLRALHHEILWAQRVLEAEQSHGVISVTFEYLQLTYFWLSQNTELDNEPPPWSGLEAEWGWKSGTLGMAEGADGLERMRCRFEKPKNPEKGAIICGVGVRRSPGRSWAGHPTETSVNSCLHTYSDLRSPMFKIKQYGSIQGLRDSFWVNSGWLHYFGIV